MNHIEQTEWAAETTWKCARVRGSYDRTTSMAGNCNLCARAPLCSRRLWERLECVGPFLPWRFYGFSGHRLVFRANLFTPTENINSIQNRSIIHATDILRFWLFVFWALLWLWLHLRAKILMVRMFLDAGCAMRTYMAFVWENRYAVSFNWLIHKFYGYLLLFWFCVLFFFLIAGARCWCCCAFHCTIWPNICWRAEHDVAAAEICDAESIIMI